MPKWLLATIPADRISGTCYNGFGGLNFSSQELPKQPKPLHIQAYDYQLKELVAAGIVELLPEWQGLLTDDKFTFAQQLVWGQGLLAGTTQW